MTPKQRVPATASGDPDDHQGSEVPNTVAATEDTRNHGVAHRRVWESVPRAQVPSWVLRAEYAEDGCELRLGGPDLRVLVALCGRWNHKKREPGFPTILTIGLDTGLDRREVRRAVRRLMVFGAIYVIPRRGRQSNTYWINWDPPSGGAMYPRNCWKRHATEGAMYHPEQRRTTATKRKVLGVGGSEREVVPVPANSRRLVDFEALNVLEEWAAADVS
jgi:hypothetical protein